MVKSELVKKIDGISDKITGTYKKVEDTVVGGYKKVESSVIESYTKIEDSFVDNYLTQKGETAEEAKTRLKNK